MLETIDIHGAVTIELADRSGVVVHRQQRSNRIVLTGRRLVAQMFAGVASDTPPTKVTHVGVGTDATPPADAQTGLLAERTGRIPITNVAYADVTEGPDGATIVRSKVSLTAVFDFADANGDASGNPPLVEAALFTAVTGGVMYNRVMLDQVHKTNAFKLTVLWDIVF